MAVVHKLANNLPDPSQSKPGKAPVIQHRGVLRSSCFVAEVSNGDSIGSTYEVARIPSHARLDRRSQIHSAGVAGLTNVDFGSAEADEALYNALNIAAAKSVDAAPLVLDAALDQPLWQVLGLDKDPKKTISLFMTLRADATAAGTVTFDLIFIED